MRAYIGLEPNAPPVKLWFALFIIEHVRLQNFLTFKVSHSSMSTIQPHNLTVYVKFTLIVHQVFPIGKAPPPLSHLEKLVSISI